MRRKIVQQHIKKLIGFLLKPQWGVVKVEAQDSAGLRILLRVSVCEYYRDRLTELEDVVLSLFRVFKIRAEEGAIRVGCSFSDTSRENFVGLEFILANPSVNTGLYEIPNIIAEQIAAAGENSPEDF